MQYNNPYLYPYSAPQAPPTPQSANTNGLVWVQGEAGAKSYLMAPGQTALLMDSENQVFYIKSTDNAGMPMPLRVFDYTERVTRGVDNPILNEPNMDDKYVTRTEYEAMVAKYEDLEEAVKAKPARSTRKESEPSG